MQSPNPPRPPYPPRPGTSPGESDRNLVAQLNGPDGGGRAVALLLARHWRATYDYAVICLASAESSASMVATAAFHRVLVRPTGGALRPRLLAAVRDTVKEWAAEETISAVLPELRKPTGGRGLLAARSVTPERRRLAERAFRGLPGASQCLLWHTEVEAEPISVPAGLLGVDSGTATAALEQVREQFRAGCVRAHRELAPSAECRFYNRLLDVPIRRGGALLPDVQRHLMECRYCRHAAEQLSHFEGGLEVLLAETVLGWGAVRYLDSRPGRGGPRNAPAAHVLGRPRSGGRHRPVPAGAFAPARRHTKAVVVGVGLISLALLATVLTAKGWSDDNGVPSAQATWGVPSGSSSRPSAASEPSSASAQRPSEVGRGRFRNPAADACLDVSDGRVESGTAAVLAACSSAGSQQWSYENDGLLRSLADPALCLGSDADRGSVALAGCVVHAGQVQYDLTVHGELLLRWREGQAVAPSAGDDVVVTDRDGSRDQRWVLEPGDEEPGESGSADPDVRKAPDQPSQQDPDGPTQQYQTRSVQAAAEPEAPKAPADEVHVVDAVAATAASAVTTLEAALQ
ncbi:RICIN domain-containing protein [Streptomyces sp. GESEQ-35]|uniref:RICIN domain-containing protein n=1 Tax=Streptomyces sp. GESEQ-35 TaxID=2812657 RepID=UPI001B33072F|nr:RICIN domain-containing protein [Streptomyces sp. GESEQ-35]